MSEKEQKETIYLSTGCTLLDLVVGGGFGMGYPAGRIINIVGDSSSGKTFVANELIARNHHTFGKKLKHNYDDSESGYTFDTEKMYGFNIITPETLKSNTVEEMDVHSAKFLKTIRDGQIGIYVIDSLDGLSSEDKQRRAEQRVKDHDKGKETNVGTYDMGTQKFLSQEFFKTKAGEYEKSNALLVIISQTRDKIDAMAFGKKQTRSGGKALDFYAHTCLWLAGAGKLKRNGKPVGGRVKAKTEKSKTPRPYRDCYFTFYYDYGIDNIGTNIDYLFDIEYDSQKGAPTVAANTLFWDGAPKDLSNLKKFLEAHDMTDAAREARRAVEKKQGVGINIDWHFAWLFDPEHPARAPEELRKAAKDHFGGDKSYTRDELIEMCEADPKMEKELEQRVIDKWESFEASLKTKRKRKYS